MVAAATQAISRLGEALNPAGLGSAQRVVQALAEDAQARLGLPLHPFIDVKGSAVSCQLQEGISAVAGRSGLGFPAGISTQHAAFHRRLCKPTKPTSGSRVCEQEGSCRSIVLRLST